MKGKKGVVGILPGLAKQTLMPLSTAHFRRSSAPVALTGEEEGC
jgi:hypothetical protein